jgi:nucleoside-diphosphate-sugar epimerase
MLIEDKVRVVTFDHRPSGFGTDVESHFQEDLLERDAVRRAAQGCDAIVHAGAIPNDAPGMEEIVLKVNVQGTWNVCQAAVDAAVPMVIAFSSINALGCVTGAAPALYLPLDDRYPRHPVSTYALSKHLMEEVCRSFSASYGLSTICLRPPYVADPSEYRPGWRPDDAPYCRNEYWSYIDIRDVCEAVRCALRLNPLNPLRAHESHSQFRATPSIHHAALLLSAEDTSSETPTEELVRRFYRDTPLVRPSGLGDETDNYHSLIDVSCARSVLGWRPRHQWRDGPSFSARTLLASDNRKGIH